MDAIEEWTAAQQRVIELVEQTDDADRKVPACPEWTVRNLLSHMVGLCVDVLRGDEPDDHNDAWTQAHVDARADRTVADLVAEWRSTTSAMQEWMRANNPRPLGDAIIHEQDLRGALGVPGGQDTAGLAAIRELFAGRAAKQLADRAPLALIGTGWQWASRGEPVDAPVVVQASDFDLARALMSRRSAAQLRAWTSRGDLGAHLAAFTMLGSLPEHDLTE